MEQLALDVASKPKTEIVTVSVTLNGKTINQMVPQWVSERGGSFVRGWVKVEEVQK